MPNITLDVRGLDALIRRLRSVRDNTFTKRLLDEIALEMIVRIIKRTSEGEDVNGAPFAPYSRPYALFRTAKGRSTEPNLTFHGSMLAAMTHSSTDIEARIFFQNTTSKGVTGKPSKVTNAAKAFFLNEDRNFFAFSVEDEERAIEIVRENLDRILNENLPDR